MLISTILQLVQVNDTKNTPKKISNQCACIPICRMDLDKQSGNTNCCRRCLDKLEIKGGDLIPKIILNIVAEIGNFPK